MKIVPNQAKIYQDFIMTVSFTLEGLWLVYDSIFFLIFRQISTVLDLQ